MNCNGIGMRFLLCASVVLVAGCAKDDKGSDSKSPGSIQYERIAQQTKDEEPAKRADAMRALAEIGDNQSIDSLIGGLEDDSELVRREAFDGLSATLNRKIYFDPTASQEIRSRQLAQVQKMWQNLVERELVEDVKKRWPLEYYYDLNSGEIFEDRAGLGPVETSTGPSGDMPAGVLAVVFACDDCGDDQDRYVAWLEVPLAKLKEFGIPFDKRGIAKLGADEKSSATVIRAPDGGEWVLADSPAASAITQAAQKCAEREVAMFCRPGR